MLKNADELYSELQKSKSNEIERLFAISRYYSRALFDREYTINPSWEEAIHLSLHGENAHEILTKQIPDLMPHEIKFILFFLFSHHEVFIDHTLSNSMKVTEIFKKDILSKKIKFAYRFGRLLYDRYNDGSFAIQDKLPAADVSRLLEGTPIGIYQLSNLLIGPFGPINSRQNRYLYPSRAVPLWHCQDTGCRQLHTCLLLHYECDIINKINNASSILSEILPPEQEWNKALDILYLDPPVTMEEDLKYNDVATLISDCIVANERNLLTEAALSGENATELRKILLSSKQTVKLEKNPAKYIAENLTSEQQLQLLLALSDKELIKILDTLITTNIIHIPIGEIRKTHIASSSFEFHTELSRLGLRCTIEAPILSMSRAIYEAYTELGIQQELEWKLRSCTQDKLYSKLLFYIEQNGPYEALKNLIFSTEAILKRVCSVTCAIEIRNDDDKLAHYILWKFGFNIPQYDDFIARLQSHLDQFERVVLDRSPLLTDDDLEKIRSSGVNLFVYLEKFLDAIISFNVWFLANDFFLSEGKVYDIAKARNRVTILDSLAKEKPPVFSWDIRGNNPLGALLYYMNLFISWIDSFEAADPSCLNRPTNQFPYYITYCEHTFLFRHTQFWADADPLEIREYIATIKDFTRTINQANLAHIRNGLDHIRNKDEFPSSESMLACTTRIRQAIRLAVSKRYYPVVFWLDSVEYNNYGSRTYKMKAKDGSLIEIKGPSMAKALPYPLFSLPYIIAPSNLLGKPNTTLIFHHKETTIYDKYWDKYPK